MITKRLTATFNLSFWINTVIWGILLLMFLLVASSGYFWSSIEYP